MTDMNRNPAMLTCSWNIATF